ncbi:MAG: acyltransferase family protein [Butyricicoccaceae bacterium]
MHQNKRNGAIDFWKFVFSVLIVIFHSRNLTENRTGTPFIGGVIGVEFFFLVSGFLMAASISKKESASVSVGEESREFLFHKIRGLYPEFLVAWLCGFVVEHIGIEKAVTLKVLLKDAATGVWELLFLRESGLTDFRANVVTWYLSAMLLAMLILVPIFLKNQKLFLNILAPGIAIFLLGYMCHNYHNLRGPTDWNGWCYKGLLRAIAELCLGCVCWMVCQRFKQLRLTGIARILLAVIELGSYAVVIMWAYGHSGDKMDYVMLTLLTIAVTITFSHMSAVAELFDHALMYWLGKFSFSIFLGHGYWSHALPRLFPQEGYRQLFPKYLVAVILTSAFIYLASELIRKSWPTVSQKIRKKLIAD